MKKRSLITLVLLFVMSFSILHEFTFALVDEDHCNVQEYVTEIAGPVQKGDICDIHFEYHLAYILPSNSIPLGTYSKLSKPQRYKESYTARISLDFIKPPIA